MIENGAHGAAAGGAGHVGIVRQMLADGVLTPEALGLGNAPFPVVVGNRGASERITVAELFANEVRPSQLKAALKVVYARAEKYAEARADRRESDGRVVRETNGSGAAFNAVGAWRCMFAFASDEQNVADGFNPALKVKKPARQKGRRTAIKEGHLGEMLELFASTGDDPELDSLVARFILITGARQ